jgi:outer membrane protein assembly factor BamB
MKKRLALVLPCLLLGGLVWPQEPIRIHTNPRVPARDVLDRLSLHKAWHTTVPMDSMRDGFYSLQLIPGPKGYLLLAQTLRGSVVAINAETGDTLWRTTCDRPYEPKQPAGWNDQAIFVVRRATLYILDRDNGQQQLFAVDSATNRPVYGMELEAEPSAGLVADDDYVFVCFSDRAVRYVVPNYRAVYKIQQRVPTGDEKLKEAPQPIRQWSFNTFGGQLLQTPVLFGEMLTLIGAEGTLTVINKFEEKPEKPVARFRTEGFITGRVGYNKSVLYVPCEDYFLYAYDSMTGRLLWRFPGQSPIIRSPSATDRDVFVTPSKGGMLRLHRRNGEPVWRNSDAQQFLATNNRFVYALDRFGNLLVLDHERGKELARYDMRDWVIPVANDITDRIYLASHDGQILCLHHRDFMRTLTVKTFEAPKRIKEKEREEEKPKEKPKEKKPIEDKDDKDKMTHAAPLPARSASDGLLQQDALPALPAHERLLAFDDRRLQVQGTRLWSAGG